MGYRGKVADQRRARELRARAWTLADIARELGVSKSSVSLWVRDVEFAPQPTPAGRRREPNALQRRKEEENEALRAEGRQRLGCLEEQAFLAAGVALYAGEGTKSDGRLSFANSDPSIVAFFCGWLRYFFDIDETRMTVRVYLHEGLDQEMAEEFWSEVMGLPRSQFRKGYRAVADPTIRRARHPYGCAYVRYGSARVHRAIMGLIAALLSSTDPFRGSSTGRAVDC